MNHRAILTIAPLLFATACTYSPLTERQFIAKSNAELNARLSTALTPPLQADDQSLDKVLAYLAREYNINMVVDWRALQDVNVERTTPITLHLHDLPLDVVLHSILDQTPSTAPLSYRVDSGILHISTSEDLARHFSIRYVRQTFDIHDLLAGHSNPTERTRRSVYIMNLIVNHIASQTWHIVQYPAGAVSPDTLNNENAVGEGSISILDSTIVITQTTEIQNEIADLLDQLRHK